MTTAKVLRRGTEDHPRYSKQQSSYKHVGGHADRIKDSESTDNEKGSHGSWQRSEG